MDYIMFWESCLAVDSTGPIVAPGFLSRPITGCPCSSKLREALFGGTAENHRLRIRPREHDLAVVKPGGQIQKHVASRPRIPQI
jgi:hypothetical protein